MKHLTLALILTPLLAHSQTLQFGPPRDNQPPQVQSSGQAQLIDDVALVINQEAISRRQLQTEIAQAQAQLPAQVRNTPEAQQLILEHIINQHLIAQLAQQSNIKISAEDIDQAIARIAAQNNLTPAQLLAHVNKDTGMSANTYRQNVAQQLLETQLKTSLVGDSIRITPQQINEQLAQIARERGTLIHLQDLLIPTPDLPVEQRGQAIKESLATLSQALKTHDNDLSQVAPLIQNAKLNDLGDINIAQIPPRFARAIIGLNQGEIVSNPVIDADGMHFLKVLSLKNTDQHSYIVPEAKLSHILIRHTPNNPSQAKNEIDRLYQQLQQGANFAELARQYSQDPGSAAKGGELGWMSADSVDPRFAQQLASVPLNTISPPFESTFGWHIILVTERRETDRSENRIREQIRESLYQAALEDAWNQRLQKLRQQAYIDLRN